VVLILFLNFVHLSAQDDVYQRETGQFFPDFAVESLHEIKTAEEVLLPFIFNGYLYTFSLQQKQPVWRIFIGGDLSNPFVVSDGTIYLYDIYNRVYSIDIYRGEILWRISLQSEIKGEPRIYKKYVMLTSQKGIIYMINHEKGSVVYNFNGEGDPGTGLSIHNNLMIATYKSGRVLAYDVDTKKIKWTFSAGGIISVSPVVKDGYLFFGSWDDTFYVLNAGTGKPLWISYVGENISRDFIIFKDEIILFFSRGQILCIRRDNGEIKWVRYFGEIEFNYNYFEGKGLFYLFVPDFIALSPRDGGTIFNYRERAFYFYKEMLFENMIEGKHRLTDEDRMRLLSDKYFTISNYPLLPPVIYEEKVVYFVTDNSYFYIYDLKENFFIVKFKLS
jgi:outer membrane protein assembly factor BamB